MTRTGNHAVDPNVDLLLPILGAVLDLERGSDAAFPHIDGDADLVVAAARHLVVPVVAPWADRLGVSSETTDLLRAANRRHVTQVLAGSFHLRRLITAFDERGIDVIVLKGIPLAVRTTGTSTSRSVGDIDIVVSPSQVERAAETLLDLGWQWQRGRANGLDGRYRRWVRLIDNHEVMTAPDRPMVEIHWRLAPTMATQVAFDRLWASHRRVPVAEVAVPVLGDVDDLVFTTVHASKHRFERLKWAVDTSRCWRAASSAQREQAFEVAQEWQVSRAFLTGLGVMLRWDLIDPSTLDGYEIFRDRAVDRWVDRVAVPAVGSRLRMSIDWYGFQLHMVERWPDRARLMAGRVAPSDVLSDPAVPALLAVPAAPLRPLWRWKRDRGAVGAR